jgi:hypothetical protein
MTAPTPPEAPQATPPAPTVHVNPYTRSGVSNTEAATLAEWARKDLASGRITQAAFDRQADELNLSPEQRASDTRSEEMKQLDAAFPVARPEDYRINHADSGQDPPPITAELKAFDQSARTCLSSAGFPRDVGNSLVNAIAKTA